MDELEFEPEEKMMMPGGKSAALGKGLATKDFEVLVADAWEQIPEKFRERVKNVALLIEDEPDEETIKENNLSPNETLLGLYRGVPATERGSLYGIGMTLPDTITIYKKPILDAAAAEMGATFEWGPPTEPMRRRIRDVVRETLWHELAHYFGMDEFEVREREEEGTNHPVAE